MIQPLIIWHWANTEECYEKGHANQLNKLDEAKKIFQRYKLFKSINIRNRISSILKMVL